MTRSLTPKQKKFADLKLELGNGTQAALLAYNTNSKNTAKAIASENLTKPNVIAYLESKAENASIRLVELSEQDINLPVSLGATKDILDRSGYKPVEKTQSLNINVNLNDPEIKELSDKINAIIRGKIEAGLGSNDIALDNNTQNQK